MSVQTGQTDWSKLAARAVVAGFIGGVSVDLFLFVFGFASFTGNYQLVASGLVGKVAYTSSAYVWLGVALHFMIAIVWAELYAYVAFTAHALHRWLLSGTILGIVVVIVMDVLQVAKGLTPTPSLVDLVVGLVANVVFYSWPVAWYLRNAVTDEE